MIDAELGIVIDVLNDSSYTSALGIRLYALAAELSRMAGWASFDAGLHAAAQRYWISALHLAHAADDRLLGANILKSMSLQCYDFAMPAEALALAQSAYAGSEDSQPRAKAMLALREARAHAALKDAKSCERLIREAEASFGSLRFPDDHPAWLTYFDQSEYYAQMGTCYLDLGDSRRADFYLQQSLSLAPDTKIRDRATYVIRRAAAQAASGEMDEAAHLIKEAVPLIHQAPSERNLQRIHRTREKITFSGSDPRGEELDEQLAGLVA
ncbi:transcriptional regulator [Actinoplanes sp. NPDC051346]|uniref:transcriptional regulator n=1 Tax=Actinoplanes sp. NPDC051346 TaxID=3155048 RepID=UPI003416DE28